MRTMTMTHESTDSDNEHDTNRRAVAMRTTVYEPASKGDDHDTETNEQQLRLQIHDRRRGQRTDEQRWRGQQHTNQSIALMTTTYKPMSSGDGRRGQRRTKQLIVTMPTTHEPTSGRTDNGGDDGERTMMTANELQRQIHTSFHHRAFALVLSISL